MIKIYSYERDDKGRRVTSRCFVYHDENNYAIGQAICHEKDIKLGRNRHKRGRIAAEERAMEALSEGMDFWFNEYEGKIENRKLYPTWKALFKPDPLLLTYREKKFLDKQQVTP